MAQTLEAEVAPGSIDTQCVEEETSSAARGVSSRIDPPQTRSLVCSGRRSPQQELKRGAAGGLSGMTVEHLQPLLDRPKDFWLFFPSGGAFSATAGASGHSSRNSHGSFDSVAQGRWRNCGGRRRSQIGCAHSVSTIDGRSAGNGSASVCHGNEGRVRMHSLVLQALTELNSNATILSVDGMSAYDMMSRKAVLQGSPTRVERVGHASGPPRLRQDQFGDEEHCPPMFLGQDLPFWKTCKLLRCCWSIVQLLEPIP